MCACPFKTLAGFTLHSSGLGLANTASVDKREMQNKQPWPGQLPTSAIGHTLATSPGQDSHATVTPLQPANRACPRQPSPAHTMHDAHTTARLVRVTPPTSAQGTPGQHSCPGQHHRMPLPPAKMLHRTETGEGKQKQVARGMASKMHHCMGTRAAEPAVCSTSQRHPPALAPVPGRRHM